MKWFLIVGAGAAGLALWVVPASASPFEEQVLPQVRACVDDHTVQAVDVCTASIAFIASRLSANAHENAEALNDVLLTRGRAYFSTGQYDRAIADFSSGIERLAAEVSVEYFYRLRGYVLLVKGEDDLAIQDFDRSLRSPGINPAGPNFALALYGRGLARHHQGNEALAVADIAAATKLDPQIVESANKSLRP
jgi:tetratricopeptide (TPR) repeat protein